MTLLNTINVGGTDFGFLNNTVSGACATPAGSEIKVCAFEDAFELRAGIVVTVKFTYANTYGDGSTTYPKLSVNGNTYPVRYTTNAYAGAGAWVNGQTVPFMFDGNSFLLVANLMQTSTMSTSNTIVNGAPLYNGANVKVMFTSAITGADTSTGLVLTYNGSNIAVKVPVNGALVDYVAKAVDESGLTTCYYCQAYTTFELLFDGTNFIITENPAIYSNSDRVIYADGSITYSKNYIDVFNQVPYYFYSADDLHELVNDSKDVLSITLPKGVYSIHFSAVLEQASPNIRHVLIVNNQSVSNEVVTTEIPSSNTYTSANCDAILVIRSPSNVALQLYSNEPVYLYKYSYEIVTLRTDF